MEYLLVMALSGSTMTCIYLTARLILRERLCARAYYLLGKAAVLYYLIPLPFLKSWYREIVPADMWESRMAADRIPLTWTNYAVHAEGDFYVNLFVGVQTAAVAAWVAGVVFLIVRKLIAYLRMTRHFAVYADTTMAERDRDFIAGLKKEYGVKRRVSLLRARDGDPTFTFGILRPVIICAKDTDSREAELLVRHEMVHIMRLDVLWKILVEFVTYLHWWNVFAWLLRGSLEHVSECACDETVMREGTEEEIDEYLTLLIEEAGEKKIDKIAVKWKAGFGSGAKHIRERMENLMRKSKWSRLATGALTAALILANSMTAFAYRDTFHETITEDVSQEEIDRTLENDIFLFNPGGADGADELTMKPAYEILYEYQFVDEDGNIYEIVGDDSVSTYCNHIYVSGTAEEHRSFSNGGCEVREFNAQRCAKCGWVIRGDLIATYTWVTCPHK